MTLQAKLIKGCIIAVMIAVVASPIALLMFIGYDDARVERTGRMRMALWDAAGRGDVRQVNDLLHRGADPNSKTANGYSPLRIAEETNHKDVAKILIEHGARR